MQVESTDLQGVYVVNPYVPAVKPKSLKAANGIRAALAANVPGAWTSDHRAETERFSGWHYIGAHAVAIQAFQASVSVYNDEDKGDTGSNGNGRLTGPFAPLQQQRQGPAFSTESAPFPTESNAPRGPWIQRRDFLKKSFGSRWKSMIADNEPAANSLPEDHPLVKLLCKPNPTQSGGTFLYEAAQQLELTGTCIMVKVPNKLGRTVELYVVPTAVAEPIAPTREMPEGGYRINPALARQYAGAVDSQGFSEMRGFYRLIGCIVPAKQCIIIRWPHPMWKDDGQSPVAASALWTDTADMVDKARWGHLHRGPDPSVVIGLDEQYDPDDAEIDAMQAKLQARWGGADKSGNVMIVKHGTAVEGLSKPPKDMDYTNSFVQMRDALLGIHQVPTVAAGITDGGSYAAFVASLRQFITLKVQPLLSLIAGELTSQLAVEFGTALTVEIDAATVDDPEHLEKMLTNDIVGRLRTRNEARALRGLPPLPGPEGEELLGDSGAPQGLGFDANPLKPGNQPLGGGSPSGGEFGQLAGKDSLAAFAQSDADSKNQFPATRNNAEGFPEAGANGKPSEGGEFGDTSRLQWKRNIAAIRDVIDGVKGGSFSDTMAIVMLTSLGLAEDKAIRLIEDAKDGQLEPENQDLLAKSNGRHKLNGKHKSNGHAELTDADWMRAAMKSAERAHLLRSPSGDNCGTGAGGFKPGNDCADEDGIPAESSSNGREASASSDKDTAAGAFVDLVSRIASPDGGFTYQPITEEQPTKGFALSPYPERSFAKQALDLTPDDILDFIENNADLLAEPEHFLGGWHDPASGKVFLDVSMVTPDRKRAHELALAKDQIAYFDLEKFESVTVNADATSGGTARSLDMLRDTPLTQDRAAFVAKRFLAGRIATALQNSPSQLSPQERQAALDFIKGIM